MEGKDLLMFPWFFFLIADREVEDSEILEVNFVSLCFFQENMRGRVGRLKDFGFR